MTRITAMSCFMGKNGQVGPPPPVARLKESERENAECGFGRFCALSQILVDINRCRQKRTIRCHDSARSDTIGKRMIKEIRVEMSRHNSLSGRVNGVDE